MSGVPFDPNGMVMDFVRSCYKRKMRFVSGDLTKTAIATWYFAAPTALPFPLPHRFGSANWDTVHPSPSDLGDQDGATRTYYNGRRLNASDGTDFAGPLEYFLQGAPAPGDLPRGGDGITPVECIKPPFGLVKAGNAVPLEPAAGGKILGGSAIVPITPGIPCANCIGITPATVKITASGGTGIWTGFNTTVTVPQFAACVWLLNIGANFWTVSRPAPGNWRCDLTPVAGPAAEYQSPLFPDCITPGGLPQTVFPAGSPTSLSISFL